MFDEPDAQLPTHLYVDAQLAPLNAQGIYYYIQQRGEAQSGTILLKLNNLRGQCALLTQQRDFDGVMQWINAMKQESVEERDADAYIQRAIARDPDLWVIEIEDRDMKNPFLV